MPPNHNQPPAEANSPKLDLAKRLKFLNLDDLDQRRLRECIAGFADCADACVESFYAHLESFDETAQFLSDPVLVARLKISQRAHFMSMLQAEWHGDYEDRRKQVGRTHAELGVEPTWFLGSYNLFVQQCVDQFVSQLSGGDDGRFDHLRSLMKAIFLDVGLTLDEYFLASTKDLRRALDMYNEANTELRQFAHFTSHDLKTPLGTVANLCEEVIDEFGDQIPPAARELIQSAQSTAYRMSATIDELLATTIEYEDGKRFSQVSLASPIQDAAARVDRELKEKQIELTLPDSFPSVMGNRVQLREVFYNLLTNAVKYIDKQPGQLKVTIATSDSHVTIAVQDNGPGIPQEEQPRIFAPFRRLAIHRDVSGSGLGLYFTNYVVEQHGGRLWLESQLGVGSTFFVSLKRAP
ncbi:MAG: protoglobin domain-containing protein [Planctomycetota bacterium]|nr:protoglobin domain-containing protein [Planctomycetota bacterium]